MHVYMLLMNFVGVEALEGLGMRLEQVEAQERDAALGNGGLGRLAACYMDALATADYPAWGYGLRYQYGIFKQAIRAGRQVELPDYWLTWGSPWEVERPDVVYEVRFFGKVCRKDTCRNAPLLPGKTRTVWSGGEKVLACAYDVPVPGFRTKTCANIRLWASKPHKQFDLHSFNQGNLSYPI